MIKEKGKCDKNNANMEESIAKNNHEVMTRGSVGGGEEDKREGVLGEDT